MGYWVTTELDDQTLEFRRPLEDPFVNHSVYISRRDLLLGFFRGGLRVGITVGGDYNSVTAVMELEEN